MRILSLALAALLGLAVAAPAQVEAAASADATGPAGTTDKKLFFWFGLWPNKLVKFDPVTDEIAAEVQLRGALQWNRTLSHDKSQWWVITDKRTKVEVVDVAQCKVVEVHDFEEEGWIIRVNSVREIPGGKRWYVNVDRIERKLDHFVVKADQILLYNVADKKVEKRLDKMPEAIERGARISPDGTQWHVFGDNLTVVDPETLEQVGEVDLETPLFTGMGEIDLFGDDFFHRSNPAAYRMMYRMRDPVQDKRRVFGVVDIDLEKLEVTDIQEWGPAPDYWGFNLAHDRSVAAAFGRADDRTKVSLWDLKTGKKLVEVYEDFRPRRWLSGLSPDGQKIYVGGAGNDFVILDRQLQRTKTVLFDGDLYGGITILEG